MGIERIFDVETEPQSSYLVHEEAKQAIMDHGSNPILPSTTMQAEVKHLTFFD